jgi:plasmid stability protein
MSTSALRLGGGLFYGPKRDELVSAHFAWKTGSGSTYAVQCFLYTRHMTSTEIEDRRIVTIELPVDVIADLKAQAKANQRSFSGELRFILIQAAQGGEKEQ